ncbi:MAG TPA: RsmE family RNA methyltransferase [Candidatus Gastranaerophilales bacterium]|nr:RsmE family RNA methyltransferase [Candidatus Gastranaerophilales bacterium]
MPHFFIKQENISENMVFITDKSDINHILNVLRYGKKDNLILKGPENRVFEVAIMSIKPDQIECEILESYISDKTLNINITLAQSIIKSQKQDFLIQKATELGVKQIIPFVSKNTVVKFDSEKDKRHKIQRWQKIVYESAKQCQRGDLARIEEIIDFEKLISSLNNFDLKILCSEKKADISIKKFLAENRQNISEESKILLIIGPEGGWDDFEIDRFLHADLTPLTLGKLVYRAETAAIAALSHIIYEYELY